MDGLEPGQEADDAYRFQLSVMVMMLAMVQCHHTPAYKELCRTAIEKMIDQADTPPSILNKALQHVRVG